MIELRGISFAYDDAVVLRDVDLTIDESELVLVSGPTGVGKSTLLGVVTGLVPRFSGGELHGDVLLDGASIVRTPPRERAHVVGYVGQDPVAGFVTDTVEEELAYGMEQLGLEPATMRRRVEETLDLLGIADLRSRDLRTLSGGQQQRVAIGSVLTMHPRLLVLDEPTSALDPTAAEEVLSTLTRLVHDVGVSVLLAEHRLERVVPFADRMCLLSGDGRVTRGRARRAARALAGGAADRGARPGRRLAPAAAQRPRRPPAGPVARPGRPAAGRGRRRRRAGGAHRPQADRPPRPPRRAPRRRPHPPDRPGHRADGAQRLRQVLAAVGGPGRRTAYRRHASDVGGVDPADLEPAARRALVGLVPQTAADLLYLETVAEECAAADGGTGACRAILDRLVPGIPDGLHPRDLSEGQRLSPRAGDHPGQRAAGGAPRRADPRARLRREARALRHPARASPRTGTR